METKTFRGVLCTQMTCQNQINLLAVFSIWKGYLHMMNMFIGQSEMVFFRFFQKLVILGAVPKGSQPLGTRLDTHPYISKVMQQCPCSAYFELRQPVTMVSVLEVIVIIDRYFFCLSMTGFSFVSRRCLFTRLLWASCSSRF